MLYPLSVEEIIHTEGLDGYVAREVQTSAKTVERYLDILEKMFVIKKLYPYSNNIPNEIKKGYKVYFTDIGMRNSILHNHSSLYLRNDIGSLFENFFVMERIKFISNKRISAGTYFWQAERGKEIDYIEYKEGQIQAFECKYSDRKNTNEKIFLSKYPGAKLDTVTKDNYTHFLVS